MQPFFTILRFYTHDRTDFSATGCPPTGQALTGASPFAIALASPSQPAYPQPPQLFPGRPHGQQLPFRLPAL